MIPFRLLFSGRSGAVRPQPGDRPTQLHQARLAPRWVLVLGVALIAGACGDSSASPSAGSTDELSAEERCEANQAAGTVTYVSSFDFAAAASILDVLVAEAEGYFEEVCLDVEIQAGQAPSNGTIVATGNAQFSSAGSFGELVNTNVQGNTDLVAIAHYGKTAVQALVVPGDSPVTELADLNGTTIGVKGDMPLPIQAMLAQGGVDRSTLTEPALSGFDPVAHLELGIDALPVYKTNEPAQLDAAGIEYRMFDPLDFDVPTSFAVFFTNQAFLDEHPTAVEDFVRASFKGFAFSVDNPDVAVGHALERLDAAGNQFFLTAEGEQFRWLVESALVLDTTPSGQGVGVLDVDRLGAEIELLTEVGVFATEPDWRSMVAEDVAAGLYDGTTLLESGVRADGDG